MALETDELAALDELLKVTASADASPLAGIRQRFPWLSLTHCDASDMDTEIPFRVYPGFDLFLVDSSEHCWRITADPTRATGLVLARHAESA